MSFEINHRLPGNLLMTTTNLTLPRRGPGWKYDLPLPNEAPTPKTKATRRLAPRVQWPEAIDRESRTGPAAGEHT